MTRPSRRCRLTRSSRRTWPGKTLSSAEAKAFIFDKRDSIEKVLAEAPNMEDLE
ncbi:MAG: hypothetical protein II948_03220 [Synergistaceae bacterium]|nr:hypothetical protein [Synergistaceae bacterium]